MMGPHSVGRQIGRRGGQCGGRRIGQPAITVQYLKRGQWFGGLAAIDSLAQAHQALEHLHEQTGKRQVRPTGVGRGVDQDDISIALLERGDQRCSVRQPGPGLLAEIDFRLGQDLALDQHLPRHGEPGEGALGGEGGQMRGLAPGHRTTQLAIAAAQSDRQEVGRILCQLRSGEADEYAPLVDPGFQPRHLVLAQEADIGHHQNGEIAVKQCRAVAMAQFGIRAQRALDVKEVAQQRLGGL